jgi:hypothetical protein
MKLIFNHNTFIRSLLILLLGAVCCIQPGAQDIQLEENFDALGAAFGQFGLDEASSSFFPGLDDPALLPGLMPAACEAPSAPDGCALALSRLVELSSGDWALWATNWSAVSSNRRFKHGIRGGMPISRADSPECTFQVFGDSCTAPSGEFFPRANGPMGPYHTMAGFEDWGDDPEFPTLSLERDVELGLSFWAGWKHHFEEGGSGQPNDATGPKLRGNDSCFGLGCPSHSYRRLLSELPIICPGQINSTTTDWTQQKATGSYWYRATLGPVTGGFQEFCQDYDPVTNICNDPAGWEPMKDQGGTPIDTRGDPVNTLGLPTNVGSTVGNAATVYLGFSGFKHTMLDNITLRSSAPPLNAAHHWLYF